MAGGFTFSTDKCLWEGSSAEVTPVEVLVRVDGEGDWEVARLPWWMHAERDGGTLRLRPANYGRHRGLVTLVAGEHTAHVRVEAAIKANWPHGAHAAVGGILIGAFGILLLFAGSLIAESGILLALPLPGAILGYVIGGRRLAWFGGLAGATALAVGGAVGVALGFMFYNLSPTQGGSYYYTILGLSTLPGLLAGVGWAIALGELWNSLVWAGVGALAGLAAGAGLLLFESPMVGGVVFFALTAILLAPIPQVRATEG